MADRRCFIDKAKCFLFVSVVVAIVLLAGDVKSDNTKALKKLEFNYEVQTQILKESEKCVSEFVEMFGKKEMAELTDDMKGLRTAGRNAKILVKDFLHKNIKIDVLQAKLLNRVKSEILVLYQLIESALKELPLDQHEDASITALNVVYTLKWQLENEKTQKKLSELFTSKLDPIIQQLDSYLKQMTGSMLRKEWRDAVKVYFDGDDNTDKRSELKEQRVLYYKVYVRLFVFNAMLKTAKAANEKHPGKKVSMEYDLAKELWNEIKLMLKLIEGLDKLRILVDRALHEGKQLSADQLYKEYSANEYNELGFRFKDATAPKSQKLIDGDEESIFKMMQKGPDYVLAEGGPAAVMKYELLQDIAALWPLQSAATVRENGPTDGIDTPKFLELFQQWIEKTVHKELQELLNEYVKSPSIAMLNAAEFTVSRAPKHRKFNRYIDIQCLDSTRVVLDGGHNYIHANHIRDPKGQNNYICTQGPIPPSNDFAGTVDDFWLMVQQQNIEAIVMLVRTDECPDKCAKYWPETPDSVIKSHDGMLRVEFVSQEQLGKELVKTTLRVVTLLQHRNTSSSVGGEKSMLVQHFHLRNWPDHGVPADPHAVLELLHHLEAYKNVVVHCSAGVGRTGVLVAIFLALSKLRAGLPLELPELLKELRAQRSGSVQKPEQYLYIYYNLLLWYKDHMGKNNELGNVGKELDQMIETISNYLYKKPKP